MMRTAGKYLPLLLLLLLWPLHPALAAIKLCVKVDAPKKELRSFDKLVHAELGRHPTHKVVKSGCQSRLLVQYLLIDKARHLTARIGDQVPVRFAVKTPGDLGRVLSKALALVLEHDPISLHEDISRYSGMQRAMHSILKRGHNRYRMELFQVLVGNGRGVTPAPGGAFSLTRGSEHWRVFARLYMAGTPAKGVDRPQLQIFAGGDVGLTYETNARSNSSFYVSAGVGGQLLRFRGRLDLKDDIVDATKVGGALSLRAGVRMFRLYNFDLDLFALGYLPLFKTRDADSELIDAYTPSLILGLGVGF